MEKNKRQSLSDIYKDVFSRSDSFWYLRDGVFNSGSLSGLFSFLDGIGFDKDSNSYNCSVFHFLIYYCYPPKVPFFYRGDSCVVFGCFMGNKKKDLVVSIPFFSSKEKAFLDLKILLEKIGVDCCLLRDIDDGFVNLLKKDFSNVFRIKSLKELFYAEYDIQRVLKLSGNDFSNLRWHLNNFKKTDHKVEVVSLKDNVKQVVHLVGKWRKKTIEERGFSFIDVRSDKFAANFFGRYGFFDDVLCRVLKVDGVVSAFNLGYSIGSGLFAHSVGICDYSISHLAEYAQYDFWQYVFEKGYTLVNDGPTWRGSLEVYKNKFNPVKKDRFYWADLVR